MVVNLPENWLEEVYTVSLSDMFTRRLISPDTRRANAIAMADTAYQLPCARQG